MNRRDGIGIKQLTRAPPPPPHLLPHCAASLDSTMTHTGTIVYMAPEITRGERYGFAVDVYSLALTMYEICDREIPFSSSERGVGMKLALDVANDRK